MAQRAEPARAWRFLELLLLILAAAGAALASRALSPFQETIRLALSLSDNQMAVLQGPALALPTVLAAIPLGLIVDRYSRVRLLFVLCVINAVGSVLTALAVSFAMLILARCVVGLGIIAVTVTIFSLVADLYEPARRGRAKGLVVVGQYAGLTLAFAAGGALLGAFSAADGWRWALFWLTAPPLTLVALLVLILREPPRSGVVIQKRNTRVSISELWRYRAVVLPLIIGIVLAETPLLALLTWAAPALTRGFGVGPERIGAIMGTVTIVSGVLGPLLGGALADFCQRKGGPRRTVAAMSAIAVLGVPAGLFSIMPGIASASVLLVACFMVSAAIAAMAVTLFTIVVPNHIRGLCLSILAAVDSLFAFALAPVIVSLLSGAIGGPAMIGKSLTIVCVAASALCAVTFALGRRAFPQTFPA